WAPYTKMMHAITAPLNIYTASLAPLGATLKNIDFEKTESFGVNALADYTWKDLLDLDACTECGRCTSVCPANAVGKELSPRDIVLQLRDLMHQESRISNFGLRNRGTAAGKQTSTAQYANVQNGAANTIPFAVRNPQSAIIG